ncbi:MAG: hypothetical protein P4L51_29225 [Puia sp.]|nr:hypothetical protein [Puia sp.]
MRSITFSFFRWLLLFLSFFHRSQSQPIEKDSLITRAGYSNALQFYHEYLTPETRLYRGGQYADYVYLLNEGHPFFLENHLQKGSLFYDSVFYGDIDLQYDLVKGLVVIKDPWKIYKIFLINQQLYWFKIGSHLFVNLLDTLNKSSPGGGFYEQLYQGRITLYKKETKEIKEDPSDGQMKRLIIYSVSYYVKKGATYYSVSNQGLLAHAFKDRSGEMKKFIRKNRLSMRKDRENTLIKVSAWYDKGAENTVR